MNPLNSTRKYEGLFIFPPDEGPEAAKGAEKRLEEAISRLGGRILDRKDWGRRLLGFAIRQFREGHLVLLNFEMETRQVAELKKAIQLDEKILKSTLVRYEEPKQAPVHKSHAGKS